MDQQQIKCYLEKALSPQSNIIKEAEEFLQNCAKQNLGIFVSVLSQILCNENERLELRQISATLIKNLLRMDEFKDIWLRLDLNFKKGIKDTLLSTLASNNHNVRKATALAIAGIAKIEIPANQWNEIFLNLCSATSNSQIYIQNTAVIAITYILQEIEIENINFDNLNLIMNSLFTILNTSNDDSLLFDTLFGVDVLVPFLSKILNEQNNRNSFLNILSKFFGSSNAKIREQTLKIIMGYVKHYYDFLGEFLSNLLDILKTLLKNDTNENKIVCYELLGQICEIEIQRETDHYETKKSLNFIQTLYPHLLEIILQHLIATNYIEDEWTVDLAAANLISLMSQCTDFSFTQKMIEYTGNNFNSNNEFQVHAALLCFESIIETKHKEYIQNIIINSLQIFKNNLISNIPFHIKNVSALVILKISNIFGEFLNTYENGNHCLELYKFLISNINNIEKALQGKICQSLHYLAKTCTKNTCNTNIFSFILKDSVDVLISIGCNPANYDADNNICLSAFFALSSLIDHAAQDTQLQLQYVFDQLCSAFIYTLNPNQIPDNELRKNFQNYIASSLSSALTNQNRMLDLNKLGPLIGNVINSFNMRSELYEEGLNLIGSIAQNLRENFKSYIDQIYPFIKSGLQNVHAYGICSASLITLSDIIYALEKDFDRFIPDVLNIIFQMLQDPNGDRGLKPYALNIIGDGFYVKYPSYFTHLDDVMKILGLAMSASSGEFNVNDTELFEYLIKLRESIVETLTLIFASCKSPEFHIYQKFIPYVPPILKYLENICSKNKKPSFDILKSSFGLIGDFCNTYQKEMKAIINREFISYLALELSKFKTDPNNGEELQKTIDYSMKEINNAIS